MKASPIALLPLLLFLAMFIGSGIYYQTRLLNSPSTRSLHP